MWSRLKAPAGAALTAVLTLSLPAPSFAQATRYEVSIGSVAAHLFHVAAEFPTGGKDTLLLSLPAWSPGDYAIKNYARYVRSFAARDASGAVVFWDRFDKDTWRVLTNGSARVRVEFDFLADTIDLSMSRLISDFGVFLGTNLFLFEEGALDRPAEVQFTLPEGWQVATALRLGAAGTYSAPNYDELADAVTFVGTFALDSVTVDGKWLRLAVWPAPAYSGTAATNFRQAATKLLAAENALMGGPVCDAYTIFLNAVPDPIQFGGGLEHLCSHYDILPAPAFADRQGRLGDFVVPLVSHELFHMWNVKRLRPAEMWPYDYRAEQFTPLLWWSEGVTDYYAGLANWRSGLWTDAEFVADVQAKIDETASAPEPWSVEDGSEATWIDEVYVNSSQLYYPKGALLGLLADITIRDATGNTKSLDDVMRILYARFYRQGRGFTTADLLAALREAGMPDVAGFYQRYVNGRDPLPYEALLAKAGIAVERQEFSAPFVGVTSTVTPNGSPAVMDVIAGSSADDAGVRSGDELVSVAGLATSGGTDWSVEFRRRFSGRAGTPYQIVVRRGGRLLTLDAVVREQTRVRHTVGRAARPDARAEVVWRGLQTGTTAR